MHMVFARGMAVLHRVLLLLSTRFMQAKRSYSTLLGQDRPHDTLKDMDVIHVPPGAGGHPSDLVVPHSRIEVVGLYLASTVLIPLEVEVVRHLLPGSLEPGPQNVLPVGQHPVLVLFGHQRHVRPNFLTIQGMDYLEFLVAIPHVQWKADQGGYRGPFVFMPRLYLNEFLPVVLGWLCAYAKRRARVRSAVDAYQVNCLLGKRELAHGRFVPRGKPGHPSDFPWFQPLRELFVQPILGRSFLGPFLCTVFDFQFDRGKMQALAAEIRIERDLVRGFPQESCQVPGIDQAPLGAFRFLVPWTLTAPFEPSLLKAEFNPLQRGENGAGVNRG